jgi:hypothetical protein
MKNKEFKRKPPKRGDSSNYQDNNGRICYCICAAFGFESV